MHAKGDRGGAAPDAYGAAGFFLPKWGLPIASYIIGLVLGLTTESSFRQTLMLFKGNLLVIFDRPIARLSDRNCRGVDREGRL